MADPLTWMTIIGTGLSAMSSIQQGNAAEQAGMAQQSASEAVAAQKRQQAGQERASAQRAAIVERQKKDTVQGNLQAAAAAGGGSFDPTIANLTGDIEQEGEYRALTALFEGDDRAASLEYGAVLDSFEGAQAAKAGKVARRAGLMKGLSTVAMQGASLYGKYGDGGWSAASDRQLAESTYYEDSMAFG